MYRSLFKEQSVVDHSISFFATLNNYIVSLERTPIQSLTHTTTLVKKDVFVVRDTFLDS